MSSEQAKLRYLLKSKLYAILADVPPDLGRVCRVGVAGVALSTVLVVGPTARVEQARQGAAPQVGQWLSPMESAILLAIGTAALGGKEVAARTGQPYDPRLKTLLRNLVDRGILLHTAEGYRAAGIPAPAPGNQG